MKKSILILFAFVLAIATACNSGADHTHDGDAGHTHDEMAEGDDHMHDNGDAHMHDESDGHMHDEDGTMSSAMSMNEMQDQMGEIHMSVTNRSRAVFEDYLEIKIALVESNKDKAIDAAEALQKEIAAMEGEWVEKVNNELTAIIGATTLDFQRRHFENLSNYMYLLAKQEDIGMDLYWTHCPMAFDNKGANWISASKEIRNPYFGDKMLKCGKVQEEL